MIQFRPGLEKCYYTNVYNRNFWYLRLVLTRRRLDMRFVQSGLLRSILFMWYLRLLYKFGAFPEQLQRMYLDVR